APSLEMARRLAQGVGIAVRSVVAAPPGEGGAGRVRYVFARPDLSDGQRTWPRLVTPIRGAAVKRLVGLAITAAVAVGFLALFLVYLALIYPNLTGWGNGLLLTVLSGLTGVAAFLGGFGDRLRSAALGFGYRVAVFVLAWLVVGGTFVYSFERGPQFVGV